MAINGIFITRRRKIENLIGKSRNKLYRMAYAWTHDQHLADDLTQQTLFKALNSHKQLADLESIQGWLFRILANCLTDHYRMKKDFLSDEKLTVAEIETPPSLTEEQQLVDMVRNAISRLPLARRQVITLVDLEGFAYATVAQILDIPVGTVMSRLCRGREALRQQLINIETQPTKRGIYRLRK